MSTHNHRDGRRVLSLCLLVLTGLVLGIACTSQHPNSQSSFRCYTVVDSLSNESRADFDTLEHLMRDSVRLHEVEFATRYMHLQARKVQRNRDMDLLLSVCHD